MLWLILDNLNWPPNFSGSINPLTPRRTQVHHSQTNNIRMETMTHILYLFLTCRHVLSKTTALLQFGSGCAPEGLHVGALDVVDLNTELVGHVVHHQPHLDGHRHAHHVGAHLNQSSKRKQKHYKKQKRKIKPKSSISKDLALIVKYFFFCFSG